MQVPNILTLLSLNTLSSVATANGLDPVKNFCKRWYHQSQIKNGMLFIDGGLESFSDQGVNPVLCGTSQTPKWTGPITFGPGQSIVAVDMSASWNWKCNISEIVIAKTPPSSTGNPVPEVQNAALFEGISSDSQIYLYGGVTTTINESFPNWQSPTTSQYTLWGFDTRSHGWTQYDVFEEVPERPSWGSHTDVPELGLGFYLNGVINNYSSLTTAGLGKTVVPLNGLVVVDLANHTAHNISAQTPTQPGFGAGMAYIPGFGAQGVLVTIGGASCKAAACNNTDLILASTNAIPIFDIASMNTPKQSWYTQATSGPTPKPRVDFCLVVVSAPDNSSHNVYMYGGWDPTSGTVFDDVWVLTIPSFTWINTYNGTSPRYAHTCHVVGNDQMITIGGLDSSNVTDNCDWEYMSVAIYNLTADNSNSWGSVFTANSQPYGVSQKITSVIGGGPIGNATKFRPDLGWSSSSVANLFTGSTDQTAPVSQPNRMASASKGIPNWSMAGIVIGSVAALALAFMGLFYLRRRKKIRGRRQKEGAERKARNQYEKAELANTDSKKAMFSQPRVQLHEMMGSQISIKVDGIPRSELWAGDVAHEMPGSEVPAKK